MGIRKIVSGGQTGVDRAALDVAMELGLPCGGWCPQGRLAEDGEIDARYPLAETSQAHPAQRTEWNVRDSDATLIIAKGELTGGTALTRRTAEALCRPALVVDPESPAIDDIVAWIDGNDIAVLNVAGPRESNRPGMYAKTASLLRRLLPRVCSGPGHREGTDPQSE